MQEDDDFLASVPAAGDQQVLAQEQTRTSAVAPAVAPLEDDSELTFDVNKVTLQVPDRLFGPSFTAVNGISQAIGNVIQVLYYAVICNGDEIKLKNRIVLSKLMIIRNLRF